MDIQKDADVSGKLLTLIKMQRQRNKFVLWFVYFLLSMLCFFILYETFGWMIPSGGSTSR